VTRYPGDDAKGYLPALGSRTTAGTGDAVPAQAARWRLQWTVRPRSVTDHARDLRPEARWDFVGWLIAGVRRRGCRTADVVARALTRRLGEQAGWCRRDVCRGSARESRPVRGVERRF